MSTELSTNGEGQEAAGNYTKGNESGTEAGKTERSTESLNRKLSTMSTGLSTVIHRGMQPFVTKNLQKLSDFVDSAEQL